MLFTSLQAVEFMALTVGQAQRPARLLNFSILLPAHYTGNGRAKEWGKKCAPIN
jgi:hypothetical protein